MRTCPVHVLVLALTCALPWLSGCSRQEARERASTPPARPSLPLFADPGAWSGVVATVEGLDATVGHMLERAVVLVEEAPAAATRWKEITSPVPLPGRRLWFATLRFTPDEGGVPNTSNGGPLWSAPLPGAAVRRGGEALPSVESGLLHDHQHVTPVGAYLVRSADAPAIEDGEYQLVYPAHTNSVLGPRAQWLSSHDASWNPTRVALQECSRRAIAFGPETRLERALDLPDDPTSLEFAIALDDEAFRVQGTHLALVTPEGDGLGWRILLETEDRERHVLAEEFLSRERQGAWIERELDLSDFAGQRVVLTVEAFASPPGNASNVRDDIGWFAEPRLVRRTTDDSPPPGIVVCLIDTLRRDALGCYGNTRIATPHFDALANESLRFTNARSTSNWTLPAHASLFTSTHVTEHGTNQLRSVLPEELTTLAEALQEEGYATAAFTGGAFVSPRTNLDQGFDLFDTGDREIAPTAERALRWIRARRGPWFLFLHTYEVHSPYDAPLAWRERFVTAEPDTLATPIDDAELLRRAENGPALTERDVRFAHQIYEASVAYTDDVFGAFRTALERDGIWNDTLLVLTSDHGEEFFDHGSFSHRTSLYEEQVAIPLLLKLPAGRAGGSTREDPVQLLDVAPTLLEEVNLPVPFEWSGRSFLTPGPQRTHLMGSVGRSESLSFALCSHPLKWIQGTDGKPNELYDLTADPGEGARLDSPAEDTRFRALLKALMQQFPRLLDTGRPLRDLTSAELALLNAMGYVEAKPASAKEPK
ncbi:MAG: sulfatase [Planctomycetes bacterium]|nr:sulfatase [Planctomycetota bacterium]